MNDHFVNNPPTHPPMDREMFERIEADLTKRGWNDKPCLFDGVEPGKVMSLSCPCPKHSFTC
jgi:hypothetical protein